MIDKEKQIKKDLAKYAKDGDLYWYCGCGKCDLLDHALEEVNRLRELMQPRALTKEDKERLWGDLDG